MRASGLKELQASMLTKIVKFELLGGHTLRVHFNDGSAGEHDFADLVSKSGEMREPLKDPAYFSRAFLELGVLTWPNGYDIAPEWLRREMESARELSKIAAE
jgi:Protein of unknown function (DUF2442)